MSISTLRIKTHKIFTLEGSPAYIAKGFALGSFIGMLPIPGIQVFVALFLSSIMNVNKKAACLAVFNTNIFTGVFVFAFNYWLGKKILGIHTEFVFPDRVGMDFISTIISAGRDVGLSLLLGGLITGVISALLAYYIMLFWYIKKNREL